MKSYTGWIGFFLFSLLVLQPAQAEDSSSAVQAVHIAALFVKAARCDQAEVKKLFAETSVDPTTKIFGVTAKDVVEELLQSLTLDVGDSAYQEALKAAAQTTDSVERASIEKWLHEFEGKTHKTNEKISACREVMKILKSHEGL